MNETRKDQILSNCLGYLAELKEYESFEDQELFWKCIIGLTDDEIKDYELIHRTKGFWNDPDFVRDDVKDF